MTRSIDLYELQETDSAIDAAERRLDEIALELESEGDLSALDDQLAQTEFELSEAQREQRASNDALADQREKTEALEQKLYSGEVKLARELKTLQDDLEANQRLLSGMEGRALAAGVRVERADADVNAAREERQTRTGEREALLVSLAAEQDTLRASIEHLRARRQRQTERVDSPDLTLYERLRRARAGRAVSKVERGTCQGCRITLPTTVFQRARSGLKIVQCTSCERILYVV